MAKILCITTSLKGILHAGFQVVSVLEKAGHEVTYACPWDVENAVTTQGFRYLQLPEVNIEPAPSLPEFPRPMVKLKKLAVLIFGMKRRRMEALNNLGMDAFVAVLEEMKPDLVLIDLELHDFIMTAVSRNYPTVLLSQWFSIWKNSMLPPISHSTIPGKGWSGHRLGIATAWIGIRIKRWRKVWKSRIRSGFTDRASVLRYYAKTVGFPVKELIEYHPFPPPFTYRRLPAISMTAQELEFPHTPRPNLHYSGPMVFLDRKDTKADPGVVSQLDQIFKKKHLAGSKLIYCSVTTMSEGDQGFLSRVVEAVSDRPEWMLIIGLGGSSEKAFIGHKALKNVYAFKWVPQLQVLSYADCSINHGGIHTINECIHFAVPMLIYSGKKHDQNGCAARVAYHGLGISANKDADSVATIRLNIERILSRPNYQENVDRLKSKLDGQKNKFVEIVESFIE